jgi:site-specific DNA-methyltransferase (adenine-specific)
VTVIDLGFIAEHVAPVLAGTDQWCVVDGECLDVMRAIPDLSIDHVITDPPYEEASHTKSRRSQRGGGKLRKGPKAGAGFVAMPIGFAPMDAATRYGCAKHWARLCRRWCLVFCEEAGVPLWRSACESYGLVHRRAQVWVKPDSAPQFTGDRPATGCEMIETLHAKVKGKSRWNGGGDRGVYVHNCNSQTRKPGEDHDTPKPVALMMELVEKFTDPGDLILDPFCGSGTTIVAALRLGRRAIGIDNNPKNVTLSIDRVRAECVNSTLRAARAGQMPLFGVAP